MLGKLSQHHGSMLERLKQAIQPNMDVRQIGRGLCFAEIVTHQLRLAFRARSRERGKASLFGFDQLSRRVATAKFMPRIEMEGGVVAKEKTRGTVTPEPYNNRVAFARDFKFHSPYQRYGFAHQVFTGKFIARHGRFSRSLCDGQLRC